MKKHSIAIINIILIIIMALTYLPTYAEPISDPFHNDLFDVVTQVQYVRALGNFKNGMSRCYFDDINTVEYVDYAGRLVVDAKQDNEIAAYLTLDGNYNDGVRIEQNEEDKWVYMDMNTTQIGEVPLNYGDYNIGYFSSITNNYMGAGSSFTSTFTNIKDDSSYTFNNTYIPVFDDNGYSIMNLNDENGNPAGSYIIKAKKSLIPTVQLDGKKIKFDQIPVIENGRTLVPLRGIFEAMGTAVDWNGATQTVTAVKGNTRITLTIDNPTALKNDEPITLDVPAKVVNGRTLVPVRFIADCFAIDVAWDGTNQIVKLTSSK